MLIMAFVLVGRSPGTAALVLCCFIIPNLLGIWLWFSRVRLSIYTAVRIFLPILGLFSILAVFIADQAEQWMGMGLGGSINDVSATSTYVLILVLVIALMIMFYAKERRHLNISRSNAQPNAPVDADKSHH